MRRLIYPALILLSVLAHAQAKTQTSTLTAPQSPASVATLEAKANKPHVLPAVTTPPAAPAVSDSSSIMVPMHQTVIEHTGADTNSNDSTIGYSFNNGVTAATAPRLIHAVPLTMSLRDLEAEGPEASVQIQLTVDLTGAPKDVKVLRSGGATLDKLAIQAVNQYRFKAATQNNLPVQAPVTIEIKVTKL